MNVMEEAMNLGLDSLTASTLVIKNVIQFKEVSLPWLPSKRNVQSNIKYECVLKKTLYDEDIKKLYYQLYERSLPYYLHKRFYAIDTSELYDVYKEEEDSETCSFASLASLGVIFHETLGVNRQLHTIFKTYDAYNKIKNNTDYKKSEEYKKIVSDISSVSDIITFAVFSFVMKPIRDEDLSQTSSSILLEPSVIVQLPWKPTVFHQWLVAALSEVLIFEKHSLELRHWPLTKSAQETATELLKLITQLKERVTLGFVLVAKLAESVPNVDSEIPNYILNDIVLPSLPVLKYLITGKAHHAMKVLKKICWSNFENSDQIHFVSHKSYSMDQELDEYYSNMPYNFPLWLNNEFNHPLPTSSNVSEIITRLQTKSQILPAVNSAIPSYGQELALFKILKEIFQNKESELSNEDIVSLAIKIIKEQIVEKEKLAGLDMDTVQKVFSSQETMMRAGELLDENPIISPVHNALRHVLMYQTSCDLIKIFQEKLAKSLLERLLKDGKERRSAISRIISMQLETVQREMLVKLTHACSDLFNIRPTISNIDNIKVISYSNMLQSISLVHSQIADNSYAQLLSELPSQWQKPVNYEVPLVQAKYELLAPTITYEEVAQTFEDRVGTLLYNIAKETPNMHLKGCEQFPYWHIVQYILPAFVAGYLVHSKHRQTATRSMCSSRAFGVEGSNENGVKNYAMFVHEFIKHYEQSFKLWLENKKIDIVETVVEEHDDARYLFMMYGVLMEKWREYFKFIIGSYIYKDANFLFDLTIFDSIFDIFSVMPYYLSANSPPINDAILIYKKWYNMIYPFYHTLYEIIHQTWNSPIAGIITPKYPKLGELYYASAILGELDVVFDIVARDRTYKGKNITCESSIAELQDEMKEIRLQIYQKVVQINNYSKEYLERFVNEKKEKLLQLYNLFKNFYSEAHPIQKFCLFDKLPCNTLLPEVKNAVIFYMNGNFDALDQLMKVFDFPLVKKCRKCSLTESNLQPDYIVCEHCIEQKYPDIHYFCSVSCKDAYWQTHHMVEHTEFETGVSDLIKCDT